MKALFKNKKDLVLNSADSNEQIVLEEFINKSNSGKFNVVFTKLLDINGDVNGMAIELKKKETEPSTPTNVED